MKYNQPPTTPLPFPGMVMIEQIPGCGVCGMSIVPGCVACPLSIYDCMTEERREIPKYNS